MSTYNFLLGGLDVSARVAQVGIEWAQRLPDRLRDPSRQACSAKSPAQRRGRGYLGCRSDLYAIGAASWRGPGVRRSSGRAVARRLLNQP